MSLERRAGGAAILERQSIDFTVTSTRVDTSITEAHRSESASPLRQFDIQQTVDAIARPVWDRTIPVADQVIFDNNVVQKEGEVCEEERWGAFGQLMFIQELDGPSGKKIKKIAAVSFPCPSGVDAAMVEEMGRETLAVEDKDVQRWDGINEGKQIVAMKKSIGDQSLDLGLLDRFIGISGKVIDNHHPDREHEFVENFFDMQDVRGEFLPEVKRDVMKILQSPDMLRHSAFDPKYKQKGIYVMEMRVDENGEWWGNPPVGDPRPVVEIAADEPHLKWLTWAKDKVGEPGNGYVIDGEDDTVGGCGRDQKRCAEFFDLMEATGGSEKVLTTKDADYTDMFIMPTIATALRPAEGRRGNVCQKHQKDRSECNCAVGEMLAQAD